MPRNFSRYLSIVAACIAALLISACADQYWVTVDSKPQGAKVWEAGGNVYYVTPVLLPYNLSAQAVDPRTGCKMVKGFHAQWKSGAKVLSRNDIQLCGEGNAWIVTIERPANHPNIKIDLAAAREIFTRQQREKERAAAQRAKTSEALGYAIGCAIAGGCSSASASSYADQLDEDPTTSASSRSSSSYVGGRPQMAPDGSYVGGRPQMAPDGSYVGGRQQ